MTCTGPHLVLRVGDHGWLPFAVGVIVPVFWLVCIGVRDVLRLVPVLVAAGSHRVVGGNSAMESTPTYTTVAHETLMSVLYRTHLRLHTPQV